MKIINSSTLTDNVNRIEKELDIDSRIMVRVSGTEPKIRFMVECKNEMLAIAKAHEIEKIVYDIDGE